MGKKAGQEVKTKSSIAPPDQLKKQVYGANGYVQSADQLNNAGLLNSTSPLLPQAVSTYADAAHQTNPLLSPALDAAKGFITGGAGTNPYLQNSIDSQLKNITQNVVRDTSTEAAMAGRTGSPAQQGIMAERIGAAAAPVVANTMSNDFNNRQNLAAQFSLAAPQIGGAMQDQTANSAGLLNNAANLDSQRILGGYDALQRYAGLLNIPSMLGPVQTGKQMQPGGSRLGSMVGGAISGFASGGLKGAAMGGLAGAF